MMEHEYKPSIMFDENSLYREIVKMWGDHGAHADVYREVLKRASLPTTDGTGECKECGGRGRVHVNGGPLNHCKSCKGTGKSDTISKKTLAMLDESIKNLKEGNVSEPISQEDIDKMAGEALPTTDGTGECKECPNCYEKGMRRGDRCAVCEYDYTGTGTTPPSEGSVESAEEQAFKYAKEKYGDAFTEVCHANMDFIAGAKWQASRAALTAPQ